MRTALHATCTAQAFRPSVTNAMLQLGNRLGLDMSLPKGQTCCGLPAWDAGLMAEARTAARQTLTAFAGYDAVVTPSTSCLKMLRQHIPSLLADELDATAAQALAASSSTWADYLVENVGLAQLDIRFNGRIAFFCPCQQDDDSAVRHILAHIRGATVLPDPTDQCCGYGNNLVWRHRDLSRALATPVVGSLRLSGADIILTTDVGCLLRLAPLLRDVDGPPIHHLAEFLAAHTFPASYA